MPMLDTAVPICIVVALILCLKQFASHKSQKLPLPPGPHRLPILGNLLDWPSKNEWKTWAKWGQQYGDVVYASVGTTRMILLNSVEAANRTLSEKGSIYSDRPRPYFVNEHVGWKDVLTSIDDGPRVRAIRRLLLKELATKATLGRFESLMQDRVQHAIRKTLHDHSPERLFYHVHTLFSSIILDVTFGYKAKDEGDEIVARIERVTADAGAYAKAGSVLVDAFPWIKWLPSWMPGTGYRELGRRLNQDFLASRDIPYAFAQHQMTAGMHASSFVANNIEGKELSVEDESMLKNAALVMYAAGAETTISAALSFILLMVLHPEVQARAQAEIDLVVGSTRLPKLSDREHLSYLNAIISEVLRFGEIAPTGVPHVLREDDMYNGFLMPKGTTVFTNIWAMSRDSNIYTHPERFDPDRFMGSKPELDPRAYVFGFGRRICPGRFFAENGLFLLCATLLVTFNITKTSDADGNEITPPIEYEGRAIRRPKMFHCKIRTRSTQAEALLNPELMT